MDEHKLFSTLKERVSNAYPSTTKQSSAVVICKNQECYYGTVIHLPSLKIKITAITCALYNSIAAGQRKDMQVFVFCHTGDDVIDQVSVDLLHEFNIDKVVIWVDEFQNRSEIKI